MYCGFKSKGKSDLLIILQEVRCLLSEENETDDCDFIGNPKIVKFNVVSLVIKKLI